MIPVFYLSDGYIANGSEPWKFPQTADLREVFARARASCVRAEAYTALLAAGGASGGVLAFTRFPLRVAIETLRALEERGAGAKIGRARVLAILAEEVGS